MPELIAFWSRPNPELRPFKGRMDAVGSLLILIAAAWKPLDIIPWKNEIVTSLAIACFVAGSALIIAAKALGDEPATGK